jgi:ketol-acid reductoisomerase
MTRGKRVIGEESRAAMKQILKEIQDGDFAKEFIAENRAGNENFDRMRAEGAGHEIEDIGGDLRDMMPWIDQTFKDTK